MTDRRVTVERDDDILLIGVDRAARRNAWDLQVIPEMGQAYDELTGSDARVGVVFRHGDHFSAGLDLAEVLPAVQEGGPQVLSGSSAYDPFGQFGTPVPKPVVLAVQIAHLVAAQAPLGAQGTLANARRAQRENQAAAKAHLSELPPTLAACEDAADGVRSFLERREARLTGR